MLEQCGVYLINLDRSPERLAKMVEGFQALGVPFQRVSAVYGPEAIIPPGIHCSPHFTLGELGCVLSHRRCYEEILKSDKPWGLIFEDDVLLEKNSWAVVEHAFQKKPKNAELVKLQGEIENPKKLNRKLDLISVDSKRT
ncbi:MAG: glycosyltransferase family 25 protein, partial [Bdellovibrionales bacterium]|nr:glycosyltransferase family 25 protein [Bdellovibrionales bacterium]